MALTKEAFLRMPRFSIEVSPATIVYSNELTLLTLDGLNGLTREHCGGGLLFQY